MESLIYCASRYFYAYIPTCYVIVFARKSAPIVVAESRLKPQFSPKKQITLLWPNLLNWQTMETLNEKKLQSHWETLQKGRKKGKTAVFDKKTTRTKTSCSPGDEESAGKGTFLGEEIDFWQVERVLGLRTLSPVLLSPTAADARRTSSHKLVNVLRFSELLVKKLTTYGTVLSLCPSLLLSVTFSLPVSPSLPPRTCEHSRLNPADICLPNLIKSILTPSRTEIVSSHKSGVKQREGTRVCGWLDK